LGLSAAIHSRKRRYRKDKERQKLILKNVVIVIPKNNSPIHLSMVKPWLLGALLKTLAFAEDFEVRGEAAVG
jgi:hypothetical protein